MSKEAMKLALEALETKGEHHPRVYQAITALREALAKPDFWEGYVPEPVKPAQCKYPKCSYPCTDLPDCRDAEQPAQQALDKKAENARELGLDYEPAQQEPVSTEWQKGYLQGVAEQEEKYKWDVHSCGPTCKRYACVAIREAVEAEREACAKVCESEWSNVAERMYGEECAAAIRARGNT